jgi:hypothetical protein
MTVASFHTFTAALCLLYFCWMQENRIERLVFQKVECGVETRVSNDGLSGDML